MFNLREKLLRPLFYLASKPGLGNPHTPYEAELMTHGVKPVAIMDSRMVTTQMQAAIDAEQIIKIDEIVCESTYRIYCSPFEVEDVSNAAGILQGILQSHNNPNQTEILFLSDVFETPIVEDDRHIASTMTSIFTEMSILEAAVYEDEKTETMNDLLAKKRKALPPIQYDSDGSLPYDADLEYAVERGDLSAVDFKTSELIQVFAQADKQEEGKELFARYHKNGDGYEPLEGEEGARRIGQLLGFTDNDIS